MSTWHLNAFYKRAHHCESWMIGKQSTRLDHSVTHSEIKLQAYRNHTTTSDYSTHTRLREW
jgi:hypothetical protein